MQKTPHKTGQKIDEVIDRLNSRWNLQIPRLHGADARKAGESAEAARKCSSRILALCWNSKINIDEVVNDFEERAARIQSEWICEFALENALERWHPTFTQEAATNESYRQTLTGGWHPAFPTYDQIFPQKGRNFQITQLFPVSQYPGQSSSRTFGGGVRISHDIRGLPEDVFHF